MPAVSDGTAPVEDMGELVAAFPMAWVPLGDSGVEIMCAPPRGNSIPVRFRTAEAKKPAARNTGGRK